MFDRKTMSEPWIDWEGAAEELLDGARLSAPIDAFKVARACELDVVPYSGPDARLEGHVIRLNTRMRETRQHFRILHEIAHLALARHRMEDSEDGANWVAGALLLPRRAFGRDLAKTAWSLPRLRELHCNASAEAIAIRTVQLRDAVATIIDGRKVSKRLWSPWIDESRLRRLTRFERELAAEALERGEEVRGDELCYAVPVIEGRWRRVIVVCELEQLSLRL
ncbi:MAG: ImmA/IrrE family metallo-endopeptidase [Sandaracinaceae bacterium]|nr:ImmA/IrrE family metallo-endopeptidase [Sandaracinaceae bacterium]